MSEAQTARQTFCDRVDRFTMEGPGVGASA